jgi:hypothetical protein
MINEMEMLDLLLEEEDRLSGKEKDAFEDMRKFLEANKHRKLSEKQHKWVESKFEQLNDTKPVNSIGGSEPLKRSYKAPLSKEPVVFPWEKPGYQKPLKPPR